MTLYWNLPATVYLFSLTSTFQIWESIMFNHYTSSTKRRNGSRGRCNIYFVVGWLGLNSEHPWNHNRVIIARPGWMCCIQGLIFYRMPCTFWLDFSLVSLVGVSMLYLPPVSLQFTVSCISCISSNMHFLSHVIVHLPSCVLLACQRRLCTITGVSGTH